MLALHNRQSALHSASAVFQRGGFGKKTRCLPVHNLNSEWLCPVSVGPPHRNSRNGERRRSGFMTMNLSTSNNSEEARPYRELSLITIGGGAAGYFGSIHAKEYFPNLDVVILEKSKPLGKVRISGGGRCNVTTGLREDPIGLSGHYPRGQRELRGSFFRTHGPQDTAEWFKNRGVPLKVEADGRMFPESNDSSSVVECLQSQAHKLGVKLKTGWNVSSIKKLPGGKFEIQRKNLSSSETITIKSDFVLLASGGTPQGHQLAQSLGHTLIEPRPSLFTFKIIDSDLTSLNGVSFPTVRLTLQLPSCSSSYVQSGSLLITHWGVSGPAVLRLSAWAARMLFDSNYKGLLFVDFAPEVNEEALFQLLASFKGNNLTKKVKGQQPLNLQIPKRFWVYLLQRIGIEGDSLWGTVPNKSLRVLSNSLKKLKLEVAGKGAFKEEFVTAGGVPLSEINLRTMESKFCSGLFLAGEIVDIDGVTGGFNFQNAWTGGFIAGTSIAKDCLKKLEQPEVSY